MNSTATILCTAAVLSALPCGPTLADSPAEPTSTVSYADISLDAQSAATTIYRRIERAARAVCQIPEHTRQLAIESGIKACQAHAIDRAVRQANVEALTALHLERTGRPTDPQRYAERR